MDRRKFVKGTGILGGLLGGVFAGNEVIERIHTKETLIRETIAAPVPVAPSNMQPVASTPTLSLMGNSEEPKPEQPKYEIGYSFIEQPKYDRKVDLGVGKDNRLWIKVDNQWRRLSIDDSEREV